MTQNEPLFEDPQPAPVGRPSVLNVRVTPGSYEAFKFRAAKYGKTMSAAIREALRDWMAKHP